MSSRFVTPEEIARFEMRVMSVGHGVLSDSEWRRLIDTLEYAQAEAKRWEDHKRITDDLRAENARLRKIVDIYWPDSEPEDWVERGRTEYSAIVEEATRRRNERARYTADDYDRGAFNEAEGMLAWLEDRAAKPRHWEDRDGWVTRYD